METIKIDGNSATYPCGRTEFFVNGQYEKPLSIPNATFKCLKDLGDLDIVRGDEVEITLKGETFFYTVTDNGLLGLNACDFKILEKMDINKYALSNAVFQHGILENDASIPVTNQGNYSGIRKLIYTLFVIADAINKGKDFSGVFIGSKSIDGLKRKVTKFKTGDRVKVVIANGSSIPPTISPIMGKYFVAEVVDFLGDSQVRVRGGVIILDDYLEEVSDEEWKEKDKLEFQAFIKKYLPKASKRMLKEAEEMLSIRMQNCFQIIRRAKLDYLKALEVVNKEDFEKLVKSLSEEMDIIKNHKDVESCVFKDEVFVVTFNDIIIDDFASFEDKIISARNKILKDKKKDVFNFGKWRLEINLINGFSRAWPVDGNPILNNGGQFHPHVNRSNDRNNYCLGNISSQYSAALANFSLYGVFSCIHSLLKSYNSENPYKSIFEIHGISGYGKRGGSLVVIDEGEDDEEFDEDEL